MDKTAIVIIVIIIAVAAGFWAWQSVSAPSVPANPLPIPASIILFYGQGCQHCKNVEDFISQNNVEEKVKFTSFEVWYNKDNQNILAQVVQKCGIQTSEVGVPFLYDGDDKCYIGDVDIINFFKNAAGIK